MAPPHYNEINSMFFRRKVEKEPSFEDRLEALREGGFATSTLASEQVLVSRNGCAAVIQDVPGSRPGIDRAGRLMGQEVGFLVDGGYQKFWRSPSGKTAPALAGQLKELHDFEEDLREALGLESLYNTSLGTVFSQHHYDRVRGRDLPDPPRRPWQN